MAGFTDAYELTVLNHIFNNTSSLTAPAQCYVAYSASSTGTECIDANYARQPIGFTLAAAGAISNSGAITFPAVAAAGTVKECSVWTASGTGSGTQITDWKALTAGDVSLAVGQQFRIPANDYDLTLE